MQSSNSPKETHATGDTIAREIAVIIPAYNEEENIGHLIEDIQEQLADTCVLVIDDASQDGTATKVKRLMDKHKSIHLVERPAKLGVGTAIRDGCRILMSMKPEVKYVVTIDADYSYDPKYISKLVNIMDDGYDVVIGSRYTKGSTIIGGHPIGLFFNRLANAVFSLIFRIKVSDSTSGFRCYRSTFLKDILPRLNSETHEIYIETLKEAKFKNSRYTETPIRFWNRIGLHKPKLSISKSTSLVSLLLFDRKDRVVEDNKIKLGVEGIINIMKSWKSTVDKLIIERKQLRPAACRSELT